MTDYTNLLERLAVSAGDQECLYADAKAAIEALQTRVAEAENTNNALRVRLGSEPHEPVTTVENRYNADGKSCHITDDLPAGMKLYAAPPVTEQGCVTVTTDESGRAVAVTRQDDEHRILSVIWEAPVAAPVRLTDFGVVDLFQAWNTTDGASHADLILSVETAVLRANGFKLEGEQ